MRARDWAVLGFGSAAVGASVMAFGGAFRWTQALVAALVACALAFQVASRKRLARTSPLLALFCAAFALTAFSLMPLPHVVRAWLDPVGTALRDDGVGLLDLATWPALSRDVPGSLRALIFFTVLLGISHIALRTAASEAGRLRLCGLVSVTCAVAAVVTCVHELFGASRLYGLYEKHASPNVLGPLLNENNLGGLMAIGTCVSVGLLMFPRQRSALRALWMANVLLCGGIAAASGSRGALVGMGAGLVLTVGALLGQRFTTKEQRRSGRAAIGGNALAAGIVGACVVVLVIYSSAEKVSAKFDSTTMDEVSHPRSKFASWRSSEGLIAETPWVGVGRGGFEPSFPRFHVTSGSLTYAFLENEYIQTVVDFGIPGAVLLTLAAIWLLATVARRWRDGPLAAGALGALLVIAVQSNVDYGVELLGVAVPTAIVAATLAYVPLQKEPERRFLQGRFITLLLCAGNAVGAVLLFTSATLSIKEDHDHLVAAKPSLEEVRESLERHPLDYLGYALASQLTSDSTAATLLNQAMRLHPWHPELHRRAAQLLLRGGHPDQAAIEYAQAIRGSLEPDRLLVEIVKVFPPKLAATAIPFEYKNVDHMVAILRAMKQDTVATLWLARVLQLHPHDVRSCNLLYEISLSQGDLAAAELAGRACVELLPDQQTRYSLAKLLSARGSYNEVVRLLGDVATWHGLKSDRASAWLELCDAYIGLSDWNEALSCLHHLDANGDLPADQHEEITKRLETVHEKRGGAATGSASVR